MYTFISNTLLFFLSLSLFQSNLSANPDEIKLLILIISSDNFPGSHLDFPYKELQENWKSYMHLDPNHVEAYFLRADPNLEIDIKVIDDVIWSKTEESVIPGILNKTILSLEYLAPRLQEFDFILRTNLSSFYVIPNLLTFLKTIPKQNCYCASGEGFGSGSGYILTPDLIKTILDNKHLLLDSPGDDDVTLGYFLRDLGIRLLPAPRIDFHRLIDWNDNKHKLPADAFHFRVKNFHHELRATEDLTIYSELKKLYYPLL